MFRFFVLLTLVCAASADEFLSTPFGRIVNGEETTIDQHPYQISLQFRSGGNHFCGGTIIGPYTIVTAAHCVFENNNPKQLQVRVGSSNNNRGGQLVGVAALKYHEKYNKKTMVNDVAVLKLATPVRESSTIRYATLADRTPAAGTTAIVSGWGATCHFWCNTLPTILRKVEVNILEHSDCKYNYKYSTSQIRDTMLCAYETQKDSCQGDSGGPLFANNTLIGVVSWGKGCAKEGYPGVYANVAELKKWIQTTAVNL